MRGLLLLFVALIIPYAHADSSFEIFVNDSRATYTAFLGDTASYLLNAGQDDIRILHSISDENTTSATLINAKGIGGFDAAGVGDSLRKSFELDYGNVETLDKSFLESEGYLENGRLPVIITLNVENENKGLGVQSLGKTFDGAKAELLSALGGGSGTGSGILSEEPVSDLRIIDAVATSIEYDKIEEIKNLNAVKKVDLDRKVQLLLSDSVPLINATQVWQLQQNSTNVTGKGVTIAIIDTGIDYTHPDLGGCLGSSCKIAGGFDYVNVDSDPMDDHGHGTHVAATAASNGTLKGVAPDARLYGYKVLSSGGWGFFSWVISGVERATDPNNDGNFSDHADIISMSLGGFGDEDSPLSLAVDKAVDRGVVAVVAAGNSGSSTDAIGTPGSARKAITVAATDKSDAIAYFSSRGPTPKKNLKPDVSAPGVNICAAQWNGWLSTRRCFDLRHISISGTSMATPHVAGAAALLLQLNRNWTPQMVKSALLSTSKDLGLNAYTQGTGRIDVYQASRARIATDPPAVSFGQIAVSNVSQIITIQNLDSQQISVNITLANATELLGKSINVSTVNQSSLTIPANSNRTINFSVNVGSEEGTFYGFMNITDGNLTYRVPYGFVRLSRVTVTLLDGTKVLRPFLAGIHNGSLTITRYVYYPAANFTFSVPSGSYDIHAIGDWFNSNLFYVLSKNVTISAGESLVTNITLQDANAVTVRGTGIKNETLEMMKWQYGISDRSSYRLFGMSVIYFFSGFSGNRTIYVSNTENSSISNTTVTVAYIGYPLRNNTYNLPLYLWRDKTLTTTDSLYFMGWNLKDVTNNTRTLDYTRNDFAVYNYTYNFPGDNPRQGRWGPSFGYNAIYFWISPSVWFDISPWIRVSAAMKRSTYILNGTDWGYWHYMHVNYLRNDSNLIYDFGYAVAQQEHDTKLTYTWPAGVRAAPNTSRSIFHGTAPLLSAPLKNTNSTVSIENLLSRGFSNETFLDRYGSVFVYSGGTVTELKLPLPGVQIFRSNTLVFNQSFSSYWRYPFSYSASAGSYYINISYKTNYQIFNNTEITANFTLPANDVNPPSLVFLNISPRFEKNVSFPIDFNITDSSGISNARAFYKTSSWIEINLSNTSTLYNGTIRTDSNMALMIYANDTRGNSINYTFDPASLVGISVSISLSANATKAKQGDTIEFYGRLMGGNLTGVRIDYKNDSSFHDFDRAEIFDGYNYLKGNFTVRWTIPGAYSGAQANFSVEFNGTGIYMPSGASVLIDVNTTAPIIGNITVTGSDANDNITINATITSSHAIDRVLFESNYTNTWTNYTTTNISSNYNYSIPVTSLSAKKSIGYRFIANNSQGGTTRSSLRTINVEEIAANATASQTNSLVNLSNINTLFCDYIEVGNGDVTGATVRAEIDSANQTMAYNTTTARYEFAYNATSTGTKQWTCIANRTDFASKTALSSFAVVEGAPPSFSNINRTADPVYNDMNVTVNTTWTDDAGLGHVIFSSNYTGSWTNTTVAVNPARPYVANFTINSSNLANGQTVGWKYIANDTSGNLNDFMPVQSFSVQNRNPSLTISSFDNNKGWGERWIFKCNLSDADNDTLSINLSTKAPSGNWEFRESANVSSTRSVVERTFNITLNESYIGTSEFKCEVSDARATNSTNQTITVEKDDINVTINSGLNETVLRYENHTIKLGVRVQDTDRNVLISSNASIGRIYLTKDGSLPADDEQLCTIAAGNCTVTIDPDESFSVGGQTFFGGVIGNSLYKATNSTNATFVLNGTLFTSVNGPVGVFNENTTIFLNTTVTDDLSNSISVDRVTLEYKRQTATAEWSVCSTVIENEGAVYTCEVNTTNLTLGAYSVRYTAEKANYTTSNTTVTHQFVVARVVKLSRMLNITANRTHAVNLTDINATLEIVPRINITNIGLNVTFNSTNPTITNLSVFELGKYLSINITEELKGNITYVIIKINYTLEEINNSKVDEDSLRIWFFNETTGNWTKIDEPLGGVNKTERYVWANVSHFSDFGVGGLLENNISCSANSECSSGNCAADYDGEGRWCAPAGRCAHDYLTTFTSGETACNGSNKVTCSSGSWSSEACSAGCSAGACIAPAVAGGGGGGGGSVSAPSATKAPSKSESRFVNIPQNVDTIVKNSKVKSALESLGIGSERAEKIVSANAASLFSATRNLEVDGKSKVTLTLTYNGEKRANVIVYDVVPKQFGDADKITVTTSASYRIVEKDPEYVFYYENVSKGDGMSAVYTTNRSVNPKTIDSFYSEVYAEQKEIPKAEVCPQVTTYATKDDICKAFPTPCVPEGWTTVEKCPEKIPETISTSLFYLVLFVVFIAGLKLYEKHIIKKIRRIEVKKHRKERMHKEKIGKKAGRKKK